MIYELYKKAICKLSLLLVLLPLQSNSYINVPDVDIEDAIFFGERLYKLDINLLQKILGQPSFISKDEKEIRFYEKGVYFRVFDFGKKMYDDIPVRVYSYSVDLYLSSSWDGVERSLYSAFRGKISRGLDSTWHKDRVLKEFKTAIEKETMSENKGGTYIEWNWGPSSKWPKNRWEMANQDTGIRDGRMGRVNLINDNRGTAIFYEKRTGKVKWIQVYENIAVRL